MLFIHLRSLNTVLYEGYRFLISSCETYTRENSVGEVLSSLTAIAEQSEQNKNCIRRWKIPKVKSLLNMAELTKCELSQNMKCVAILFGFQHMTHMGSFNLDKSFI